MKTTCRRCCRDASSPLDLVACVSCRYRSGMTFTGEPPLVIQSAAELNTWRHKTPGSVAVVMTLGALHEGHLSLVRLAAERADRVVVTVFVNPLQFGPDEDFDAYPRTLSADLALLAPLGVDVVFAPDTDQVYPAGEPAVRLSAGPVGERFEGATRPGHFDGVLTVVAKLLHLTMPDVAIFGRKDAQQLALIQRMVLDLNWPVEIVPAPTVREPDGLAMSSRNRYLDATERADAGVLFKAITAGAAVAHLGTTAVTEAAMALLRDAKGIKLDYLALLDPLDFTKLSDDYTGDAVLATAAWVGTTRLIDNLPITVTAP